MRRAWNGLSAFFAPSSGHFSAGRPRRGLFWLALTIAAMVSMFWLGPWPALAVWLAQIVDVLVIEEGDPRGPVYHLAAAGLVWIVLLGSALTIRASFLQSFKIPAGSMVPTLEVGDHLFVDMRGFVPQRGDVVVFRYPKEPDKDFIKRVIAVGGDTVEIKDNAIWLNGHPIARRPVAEDCSYKDYLEDTGRWEERMCEAWEEQLGAHTYRVVFDRNSATRSWPARTIPAGHVWVLGDNRDNSHDSRYWGTVPPEFLKGRARFIYYSVGPDGFRSGRFHKWVE